MTTPIAQGPVDVNVRGFADERYIFEALETLRKSYEAAAQPYINRLVAIRSMETPVFFMPPKADDAGPDSIDAARYRWLRRQPWVKTKGIHAWGALLDNAIDEARHDAPNAEITGRASGPC